MNNTADATALFFTSIATSILFLLIMSLIFVFYCWHRIVPLRPSHPPLRGALFVRSDASFFAVGIDEAIISSYPKLLYSQALVDHGEKGLSSSSCCSICLADYDGNDEVRILPDCNHYFHVKCIDPWLRLRPTCPFCRTSPLPTPLSSTTPAVEDGVP